MLNGKSIWERKGLNLAADETFSTSKKGQVRGLDRLDRSACYKVRRLTMKHNSLTGQTVVFYLELVFFPVDDDGGDLVVKENKDRRQ